jgi:hypothetical protein
VLIGDHFDDEWMHELHLRPPDRPRFVFGPMSREFTVPTRIGFGCDGCVPDRTSWAAAQQVERTSSGARGRGAGPRRLLRAQPSTASIVSNPTCTRDVYPSGELQVNSLDFRV